MDDSCNSEAAVTLSENDENLSPNKTKLANLSSTRKAEEDDVPPYAKKNDSPETDQIDSVPTTASAQTKGAATTEQEVRSILQATNLGEYSDVILASIPGDHQSSLSLLRSYTFCQLTQPESVGGKNMKPGHARRLLRYFENGNRSDAIGLLPKDKQHEDTELEATVEIEVGSKPPN